jgi:hypothetical protein
MKRWSMLVLVLVVLGALGGLGAAQPKGEQKSSPIMIEKGPSTTGAPRAVDKASPQLSGKVTAVDPAARTYTIMLEGKPTKLSAGKGRPLPAVGTTVDLTANAADRFTFPTCEECNAVCPGVCFLGANSCRCYLEHLRTKPPVDVKTR